MKVGSREREREREKTKEEKRNLYLQSAPRAPTAAPTHPPRSGDTTSRWSTGRPAKRSGQHEVGRVGIGKVKEEEGAEARGCGRPSYARDGGREGRLIHAFSLSDAACSRTPPSHSHERYSPSATARISAAPLNPARLSQNASATNESVTHAGGGALPGREQCLEAPRGFSSRRRHCLIEGNTGDIYIYIMEGATRDKAAVVGRGQVRRWRKIYSRRTIIAKVRQRGEKRDAGAHDWARKGKTPSQLVASVRARVGWSQRRNSQGKGRHREIYAETPRLRTKGLCTISLKNKDLDIPLQYFYHVKIQPEKSSRERLSARHFVSMHIAARLHVPTKKGYTSYDQQRGAWGDWRTHRAGLERQGSNAPGARPFGSSRATPQAALRDLYLKTKRFRVEIGEDLGAFKINLIRTVEAHPKDHQRRTYVPHLCRTHVRTACTMAHTRRHCSSKRDNLFAGSEQLVGTAGSPVHSDRFHRTPFEGFTTCVDVRGSTTCRWSGAERERRRETRDQRRTRRAGVDEELDSITHVFNAP
ncbi:hypothetical protein K438DRAFT_1939858 [Mycena galopus ATCC 62051]|nr:hypothetical protein K438DRAFT_1939858 [Mycena galopus ATCC 62051]